MRGDSATYARIVSRMRRTLDRDIAALEFACGTGILSEQMAGSVKTLEAADLSEEMIQEAKMKAEQGAKGH